MHYTLREVKVSLWNPPVRTPPTIALVNDNDIVVIVTPPSWPWLIGRPLVIVDRLSVFAGNPTVYLLVSVWRSAARVHTRGERWQAAHTLLTRGAFALVSGLALVG